MLHDKAGNTPGGFQKKKKKRSVFPKLRQAEKKKKKETLRNQLARVNLFRLVRFLGKKTNYFPALKCTIQGFYLLPVHKRDSPGSEE